MAAMPPLLLSILFLVLWSYFHRYDSATSRRDVFWQAIYLLWSYRVRVHRLGCAVVDATLLYADWEVRGRWIVAGFAGSLLGIYCITFYYLPGQNHHEGHPRPEHSIGDDRCHQKASLISPKPLIFPSKIHHVRMFPKKHSFSYSYLMVGIPVGWKGSVGNFLSADSSCIPLTQKRKPQTWLSVKSADHLARGDSIHGLQGKLHEYLRSIGEYPREFHSAYLITAPTVFGYAFNPASFWYLYNKDDNLAAMIVEVNNTFDERRMYFARDTTPRDITSPVSPRPFTSEWAKDFHVSPFNSRKGSYSIASSDPWEHIEDGARFKTVIKLYSSKSHLKLTASVSSTKTGIDPSDFSRFDILQFMSLWWWVGFMTFPRIIWEAAKLFFRRKLHVWFRPEVLKESVGRQATAEEVNIERVFALYLRDIVQISSLPRTLTYISCGNAAPTRHVFETRKKTNGVTTANGRTPSDLKEGEDTILLQPTSPQFYTELARSLDLSPITAPDVDPLKSLSQTTHQHEFRRLSKVRLHCPTTATASPPKNTLSSARNTIRLFSNTLQWNFASFLRSPTSYHLFSLETPSSTYTKGSPRSDSRSEALMSPIDFYAATLIHNIILSRSSSEDNVQAAEAAKAYRRSVLKILLSDRLAFGIPAILDLMLFTCVSWLRILQAHALEKIFLGTYAEISAATWGVLSSSSSSSTLTLGLFGLSIYRAIGLFKEL